MKHLVIYHRSCPDGFGAAYAAYRALGDQATYHAMAYGEVKELSDLTGRIPGVDSDTTVYILDFSLPNAVMHELVETVHKVYWLDHHKTAFESWCGEGYLTPDRQSFTQEDERIHVLLDNTRSGALIAWEFFHPWSTVPQLIRHIDDYDRWQFQLMGTKALNKAIWAEAPWSFEQWGRWVNQPLEGMMQTGYYLLKDHENRVRASLNGGAMSCNINGVKGLACNAPPNLTSDLGHALSLQSGTYGLVWNLNKDRKVSCSLRSTGDFDVSILAKSFGGGGHKNAAGFELPSLNDLWVLIKE